VSRVLGQFLFRNLRQFDVLRRFFLPAMARKCNTPLVEPPKTIVITKAFSKDSLVKRSCGRMFFSMQTLIASAAFAHSRILAGDSAGFDEDPGRHKPIASIAVDIVFAVLWKTLESVFPFLVKTKSAVLDSGVARHVLSVVNVSQLSKQPERRKIGSENTYYIPPQAPAPGQACCSKSSYDQSMGALCVLSMYSPSHHLESCPFLQPLRRRGACRK
jgi:hypothetical protein